MNEIIRHTISNNEHNLPSLNKVDYLALQKLAPSHCAIISVALGTKIVTIEPAIAVDTLNNIVTATFALAGQKPDGVTLALYVDELYQKLINTYPKITMEEIRIALKKGVYDELGEYYGLNVKSFVQFISTYLTSSERKEAKYKYEAEKLRLLQNASQPKELQDKDNFDFINYLYNDFKRGKLIIDYIPSFVYSVLCTSGLLLLTNEQKINLMDRAKSYLTKLSKNFKYHSVSHELQKMSINDNAEPAIIIIAKQMAVYDYFDLSLKKEREYIYDPICV